MVLAACVSLIAGVLGGKFGARASTGFARKFEKRLCMKTYRHFLFSNIDKFSTAGLVTRLTTDVTNMQNAYQMILRMCTRAPASLICAMAMSFFINARLACVYLIAVIVLGCCLFLIMSRTTKYFQQVFHRYDDLNASIQENINGIRVVKAYVREDYENKKFTKASGNVYKMFVKAESILTLNAPLMQFTVYSCILLISWFGGKDDCKFHIHYRRADEYAYILYEYSHEFNDVVLCICHDYYELCQRPANFRGSQ